MSEASETENTRSLWSLAVGESGHIASYGVSLAEAHRVKLKAIGFVVGAPVKCGMHPFPSSPRVYEVGNSRFSLEREVAEQVLVEEESSGG